MNKQNTIQRSNSEIMLYENREMKIDIKSKPAIDASGRNENTFSGKSVKIWLIFSMIYSIIAIVDCCLVFKNEMNRPKRDRALATLELIQNSYFKEEFDNFVENIRSLAKLHNRTRSMMHQDIICLSKSLDHESTYDERDWGLTVNFNNGSIIKYYDQDNTTLLSQC
jgi:hypothetical protein